MAFGTYFSIDLETYDYQKIKVSQSNSLGVHKSDLRINTAWN